MTENKRCFNSRNLKVQTKRGHRFTLSLTNRFDLWLEYFSSIGNVCENLRTIITIHESSINTN